MERAGRQSALEMMDRNLDNDGEIWLENPGTMEGMTNGKAVVGVGDQLTPTETPMVENTRGTKDVTLETRHAFSGHRRKIEDEDMYFHLVDRTVDTKAREPFPVYVDVPVDENFGIGWIYSEA